MSTSYVAKHCSVPAAPFPVRMAARIRRIATFTAASVVVTGLVVTTGVLGGSAPVENAAAALSSSPPAAGLTQEQLDEREQRATRSTGDRRPATDRTKARALSNASGVAVTKSEDLTVADPKSLARALMPKYGLSASEFGCLDNIWTQESGWNIRADNPTSSAYGIPQALPGSKMASAGPDWATNAETQISWGLGYIRDRYGSACAAWSYKQGAGWY